MENSLERTKLMQHVCSAMGDRKSSSAQSHTTLQFSLLFFFIFSLASCLWRHLYDSQLENHSVISLNLLKMTITFEQLIYFTVSKSSSSKSSSSKSTLRPHSIQLPWRHGSVIRERVQTSSQCALGSGHAKVRFSYVWSLLLHRGPSSCWTKCIPRVPCLVTKGGELALPKAGIH
jgi:hypothetical protein